MNSKGPSVEETKTAVDLPAFGPCPACQGSGSGYALDPKGRDYLRCPSCKLIYLRAEQRPSLDEERRRYLLHQNGPDNKGYRDYLSNFLKDFFYPYCPAPAVVLDFGSGPEPLLTNILREEGYASLAYDPFFSEQCLEAQGPFAAVIAHEVLEHCANPLETLGIMVKLLKPGGLILISTHFPPPEADAFLSWWYRQDKTHICFFSQDCLEGLGARLGLEKLRCDSKSRILFKLGAP